jgi:hypothetical protein
MSPQEVYAGRLYFWSVGDARFENRTAELAEKSKCSRSLDMRTRRTAVLRSYTTWQTELLFADVFVPDGGLFDDKFFEEVDALL